MYVRLTQNSASVYPDEDANEFAVLLLTLLDAPEDLLPAEAMGYRWDC